jgi:Rad3-related DNA helicase
MQCVDTIELWTERVRAGLDLRYLAESDLTAKESTDIATVIREVLGRDIPSAVRLALQDLLLILDPQNLHGRITWIEAYQDGNKTIKSVPASVAPLLQNQLFSRVRTTLLIPPQSADSLSQILGDATTDMVAQNDPLIHSIAVTLPIGETSDAILRSPKGKTVFLVSSKRMIEDVYVQHGPRLEEQGVALICQGFNGGQGRMQAEFELAESPAFMVMTPWMYEGMELQPGSVDRFILQVLPFDHPNHAVVSQRSLRLRDPFNEYSLPRLKHRLFRLLRTFARHASSDATALIMDDRLRTKGYGKSVSAYLLSLGTAQQEPKSPISIDAPIPKKKTKGEKEQMTLL